MLQCNLNRSREAQDLMIQRMREESIDLCFISEPATIPDSRFWFGSLDGLAAFAWAPYRIPSCELMYRGEKFVIARCMDVLLVACYCSPNTDLSSFLELLDGIESSLNDLGMSGGGFVDRSWFVEISTLSRSTGAPRLLIEEEKFCRIGRLNGICA